MSPASYQTAPPRTIYHSIAQCVKIRTCYVLVKAYLCFMKHFHTKLHFLTFLINCVQQLHFLEGLLLLTDFLYNS